MTGRNVRVVAAWGLAMLCVCSDAALAQAPQVPSPPQPAPLAPAGPAAPAPPAPPAWTPVVPFDYQIPPVPWAGVWKGLDGVKGFAHPWIAGFNAGQQTGERQVETMDTSFPDPSRPGTLVVHLFSGSIRVKAANRKDVGIRATHSGLTRMLPRKPEPPPAGMRRLTPGPENMLVPQGDAQGNQLVLRLANPMVQGDLEVEVPARTNLDVRMINGGAIEVEGVEGNLEVNNVNGPIRIQGVSGSVVAAAVNGDVTVVMTRVAEQKVMAFSSLNGKLDVTLPRTTKANLKLRSDNADVFTDFDVVQTTPPPSSSASATATQGFQLNGQRQSERSRARSQARSQRDNNRTIYGTINGGGPEIEARSFNGSVVIRRGPQ